MVDVSPPIPGPQIPDGRFSDMPADWQQFVRFHLIQSPLRDDVSGCEDEYLAACISLLDQGLLKVSITDAGRFRISGVTVQ